MRHTGRVLALLVAATALALAAAAHGATDPFDFSTATEYTSLPQDLTGSVVTGTFTGPFSIQNANSTHIVLSQFSNNYLYPNITPVTLTIAFDQPLSSITLTFATTDLPAYFEIPTSMQLTAYQNTTATLVGSATATGVYTTDTFPQGTLPEQGVRSGRSRWGSPLPGSPRPPGSARPGVQAAGIPMTAATGPPDSPRESRIARAGVSAVRVRGVRPGAPLPWGWISDGIGSGLDTPTRVAQFEPALNRAVWLPPVAATPASDSQARTPSRYLNAKGSHHGQA